MYVFVQRTVNIRFITEQVLIYLIGKLFKVIMYEP